MRQGADRELRIPEERIFIRLEDMIVIAETEARILSDFVPRSMASVGKLWAEDGLLQEYGRIQVK